MIDERPVYLHLKKDVGSMSLAELLDSVKPANPVDESAPDLFCNPEEAPAGPLLELDPTHEEGLTPVCLIWELNSVLPFARLHQIAKEVSDQAIERAKQPHAASGGVGDVNSGARGSAARYNGGKPDLSLIPLHTLQDEARVWEYGKRKYAAWNWTKGMAWSIPLACLLRHLAAWQRGEELDQESGLPHLAHCAANLRMLTLYSKTYPEGDDRPPREFM